MVRSLSRRPFGESGHIACDNGEKLRTYLLESASKPQIASEFASISAEYDHFEILQEGTVLDIPSMELAVTNRLELGRLPIRGVELADAEFHYDMVVSDVTQAGDGTVTGTRGN